jgi:uncharacterized membrane protein
VILIILALACGKPNDTADCYDAPTYSSWAEGFLIGKCQPCHASTAPNRFGAPESVVFDDRSDALRQLSAIKSTVLERGTMPPSGGVTDNERLLLEAWLECPK